MSQLASFAVSSEEAANRALDYFNGFHDGFMQRVVIESQDRIGEDLSQTCTGIFRVEIDFAHYNYPRGAEPFHPHDQIVHAQFRNVQDVFADFSSGFLGNTIIGLSVGPARRHSAGRQAAEQCLELRLSRHYYLEEHRRYELRECRLFTFTDATFLEQPSAE
ncbi:MAG: hypothetical protein HYS04_14420 [Acidobacteria bacterium]|nr:hypothetical protein [Acidobacteriota bacterium]